MKVVMCTKTGFDGYHNADMRKCGFEALPPCLKDRRDVAVWWPLMVTGFNNTPPYHRSLNMAGATRAMQSILPSRRKINGYGMLFGLQGLSSRRESPAHVRAIKRIKTPLPYPKDNWQGERVGRRGLAIPSGSIPGQCWRMNGSNPLPPCLKDRRDETPGFNGLWFPVSRGLNKKPLLQPLQECCRPGWNHAGRVLPSRRKNMGSIVEEGITPPTGKAAGLRDYPMLPYNLHSPANEVFFSQSGASAPVMITAVRGDGVYNRGRRAYQKPNSISPITAASKIPCSAFSYRLSEPFYDLRGVMPMG